MTIAAVVLEAGPFPGNGVTTVFPFTFKCFSKSELTWTRRSAAGIEAVLVLDLDYSVTLNLDQNTTPGGSITFPLGGSAYAILAASEKLVGVSNAPETQLVDLVAAGGWFPEVVENALDRAVLLIQQLSQLLTRTLTYPVTDTVVGATLPTSTQRANQFLAFDASGNPIAAVAVTGTPVSVAMQPVISAVSLAAGRAALGVSSTLEVILQSILTTKGDIVGASAAATAVRVGVGADGTQLTADSTVAAGVSYKTHNLPARQTVLTGSVDANGQANFLTTGAGVRPGLNATATPLALAFANGFDAGGCLDAVSMVIANVADILGADLPLTNTSFIYANAVSPSAVTYGTTLTPPQYGEVFNKAKQSLLRFAGADASTTILDDYGNTWAVGGNAQVDTAVQIDGLNTLLLDGVGDYVESSSFTSLGDGSWTMEAKFRWNTLPTPGQLQALMHAGPASNFGFSLGLDNTAGTIKLKTTLSSNGTSADIAAATVGTKTAWLTGTNYHIVAEYDALAGKYLVSVDGTQDISIVSALKIAGITKIRLGEFLDATSQQFNGAMAGFRFSPCCRYPNGTAFAAPNVSTFAVEGHFFSIPEMKMYEITAASGVAGNNPTMTRRDRLFLGECDTSGAAITAARSYAYRGRYVSLDVAFGSAGGAVFNHNIGVRPLKTRAILISKNTDAGYGGANADEYQDITGTPAAAPIANGWTTINRSRVSTTVAVSGGTIYLVSPAAGAIGGISLYTNFLMRFSAERGW